MHSLKALLKSNWAVGLLISSFLFFLLSIGYVANEQDIAPYGVLPSCCGWQGETEFRFNEYSDITNYYLPNRFFIKDSIASGEFPLWNPLVYGGINFLATTQSGVLHPINLLLLFASPSVVQNISTILSITLSFLFMFIFLREIQLKIVSSIMGGVAFALSSALIFWAPFNFVWVLSVIPLSLFLLLKFRQTSDLRFFILNALVMGVAFYLGHIQIVLVLFLIYTYSYFLVIPLSKKIANEVGLYISLIISALSIGALQISQFLEQATRASRSPFEIRDPKISDVYEKIVGILNPYEFFSVNQDLVQRFGFHNLKIGYAAAVLVVFALLALVKKSVNRRIIFTMFMLFLVGITMQLNSFPANRMADMLPQINQLNPSYYVFVSVFAAAVLSGLGLEAIYDIRYRLEFSRRFLLTIRTLLLSLSILLFLIYLIYSLNYIQIQRELTISFSFALIFLLILSVISGTKRVACICGILLISMSVFQGVLFFNILLPRSSEKILLNGNKLFEHIQLLSNSNSTKQRVITQYEPNSNLYYGVSSLSGYEPVHSSRINKLIEAINSPNSTRAYAKNNAQYVSNIQKNDVLASLGVEYIISPKEFEVPGYTKIFEERDTRNAIYKSVKPAPQVYFARSTFQASEDKQLDAVRSGELSYQQVASMVNLKSHESEPKNLDYKVGVNKISITSSSYSDQTIFIAQNFDNGWKASLDGRQIDIHRSNWNFMSVMTPPGKHQIELIYRPISFVIGAIVSSLCIMLAVFILFFLTIKHKTSSKR